ncbi:uncharacterized protein [Montipora capricornis]|uniref:uncharacterized protein n=1 Tax=Montipora capricornis TaxID=246305 RepID=UPI0035F11BE0
MSLTEKALKLPHNALGCVVLTRKTKRCKRPCSYYSNSSATFHCLLVGDLVLKLNPGPTETGEPFPTSHSRPSGSLVRSRNPSNLITVNRIPFSRNGNQGLSLCLLNSRSVRNKTAVIFDYVCDCKADLVAITEIWLGDHDAAVRAVLCPDGYKLLDQGRDGRRGGGTALIFRDSLAIKKVDTGAKVSFEFSEWTAQSVSHDFRVVILYRPQADSDVSKIPMSTFFSEFSDYLETVVLCREQLLIAGDFNIHVDVPEDSDSIKLLDLLESFTLRQHVVGPTHILGHTLDLVITSQSDQIIRSTPTVSYRKIKSVDVESVNADLAESDLCRNPPDDLDELVACYDSTLRTVMDKHDPVQTRTIVVRPRVPWYTDGIRQAKKERRKAERKWRSSKLEFDLAVFKRKRNAVNNLLNKARREFYTNFIEENSGDQRRLFRESKRLLNLSRDDGLPPNLHAPTFVIDLGQYFVTKIETIQRKLDIESFDSVTSLFDCVPDDSPSVSVPLLTDLRKLVHQ